MKRTNVSKSMIVPHPLWKEVKLTKKDKADFKKKAGYVPDKLIVATDEWHKLRERLFVNEKN